MVKVCPIVECLVFQQGFEYQTENGIKWFEIWRKYFGTQSILLGIQMPSKYWTQIEWTNQPPNVKSLEASK